MIWFEKASSSPKIKPRFLSRVGIVLTVAPSVAASRVVTDCNFNIVRCPCNGLCRVKRHLNLYIDITLHYIE